MTAAALPETVVPINGHDVRLSLDPESWCQQMMREQIDAGGYERGTWETVKHLLREGDTVVDVGAHVGVFSCFAAALVGPTGNVFAYEPNADNFARLEAHKACNAFAWIHATRYAIADSDGVAALHVNRDNDGGHALWNPGAFHFNKRTREEPAGVQEVEQHALDFFAADDKPTVRLIKIDTEGAELRVLRGAEKLIERDHPYIVAEVNTFGLAQLGDSTEALLDFMKKRGYRVGAIADVPPYVGERYAVSKEQEFPVYNVLFVPPGEPMPFTGPTITVNLNGVTPYEVDAELRKRIGANLGRSKPLRKIKTRDELPLILNDLCPEGFGAEVGVQLGHNAHNILRQWEKGVLFCVDPWREYGLASKQEMDALRYFATRDYVPVADAQEDRSNEYKAHINSLGARLFAQSGGAYIDIANVPQDEQDAIYVQATQLLLPFSLAGRCQIWRMTSHEAAQLWARLKLDFVYIDARHDYTSVINDLAAWTEKVKPGGIIAGHDYLDGELLFDGHSKPTLFGVKRAVDEWAKHMGWKVNVTTDDQFPTWYVRTPE
jgi:FkbM family methyltransferase